MGTEWESACEALLVIAKALDFSKGKVTRKFEQRKNIIRHILKGSLDCSESGVHSRDLWWGPRIHLGGCHAPGERMRRG